MTLNEIASPIAPRERSWSPPGVKSGLPSFHSTRQACLTSGGSRDGRGRLLAEAELGVVAPHPEQDDDSELARDRQAGPRDATMLGGLHAPGAQPRPFARARQQRVGVLIERNASDSVAAAAELALNICLV